MVSATAASEWPEEPTFIFLICSYEKKHEGDRLKCNVCGEKFRERHHLTRHMTAHQDRHCTRRYDRCDMTSVVGLILLLGLFFTKKHLLK